MYRLYCPPQSSGKFFPAVLLKCIEDFGLQSLIQMSRERPPDGSRDWSLIIRLPSVYHLQKQVGADGSTILPGVFDILEPDLSALINANARLVLDMGVECFFGRDELFFSLHELAAQCGLNPSQIVVTSGNQIAAEKYSDYCKRRGMTPRLRFIPTVAGAWRFWAARTRRQTNMPTAPKTLRQKRFVSFNGRARPHRIYLCLFLFAHGLLENSNVSLLGYDSRLRGGSSTLDTFVLSMNKMLNRVPNSSGLRNYVEDFLKVLPLEVDVKASEVGTRGDYDQRMDQGLPESKYFDEACFNIVTETLFFEENSFYITEKSFKAFEFNNPFISISHKGTLKFLKTMGFQTFDPIINEQYDEVSEDLDRLAMCMVEVQRLGAMSDEAALDIVGNCREVFRHNQKTLSSSFGTSLMKDLRDRVLVECFA